MKLIPTIAIVLLLSVKDTHTQTEIPSPPTPATGDILLVPYTDPALQDHYEVQIYYTDGTNEGSYGGVCADDTHGMEAKVICQQMGYQYKAYSTRQIPSSSVWFTHINCDDSTISHILRCNVKVATGEDRKSCSPNNYRLLVNCDFSQPFPQYDGQVTLCPVNSNSPNRVSTSYGLVSIYYKDYQANEGITQKDEHPLGGLEADTICRNLGFTGADPWSAKSKTVDNYNFSECFSNTGPRPPHRLNHGAWVATDDIKCDGNQKCIGCCMKYPRANCQDCNDQQNIVIRCVFDPSKLLPDDVTGDRSKDCKLNENKDVAQCVQDNTQKLIMNLRLSLSFITIALILLGPWTIVPLCYFCRKDEVRLRCMRCFRRCQGYNRIADNADNANRQDEEN